VGNVSGGIVVFAAARDFPRATFGFPAARSPAIKLLYGLRLEYFQ